MYSWRNNYEYVLIDRCSVFNVWYHDEAFSVGWCCDIEQDLYISSFVWSFVVLSTLKSISRKPSSLSRIIRTTVSELLLKFCIYSKWFAEVKQNKRKREKQNLERKILLQKILLQRSSFCGLGTKTSFP